MVRHNPCTTKTSLYKMALVQMDQSKKESLYKMVVANPNKMFGLERARAHPFCEGNGKGHEKWQFFFWRRISFKN